MFLTQLAEQEIAQYVDALISDKQDRLPEVTLEPIMPGRCGHYCQKSAFNVEPLTSAQRQTENAMISTSCGDYPMKRRIFMACVLGLLSMAHSLAQQGEALVAKEADTLLDDALGKGLFSGLVIISHDGKEFYSRQYGFADWGTQKTIDTTTLFNIGSLNKQFTEEIVHQLVKEKKLSYDSPLSRYVNLFPVAIGNKITIQQLLDMKAGLGDYLRDPGFNKIRFQDFSIDDVLDIIKKEPLLFEPGSNREYSNSGYVVLGAVIEKVTGKTYEQNVTERIASPLGLKNIFYTKAEKEKHIERASGTTIDFEGHKRSIDDVSNSTPAGGIYTNGPELLKFAEAKLRSALPSEKKYGSGMFAGGTPLWNSVLYYNEKNGYAFVIMANTGNIADELASRLSSIIKNESYPPLDLPFSMKLYKTIREKGVDYVKENVKELAAEAKVPYDDRFLNYFGYQFLQADKTDIAIALFRINIGLFPKVPNTYDSAAEAYLKSGDKANALEYYKMEMRLDPDNPRVKKTVSDLEAGK